MGEYHPGKPFRLPPGKQKVVDGQYRAKNRVVNKAVSTMAMVMERAITEILTHFQKTGFYAQPSMNGMDLVSEHFYRDVVTEAWKSTQQEKKVAEKRKELAKGPVNMPSGAEKLHDIFANSKYWRSTMNRSRAMTERLRKQYQRKLEKAFEQIVPLMRSGEISPEDAKTHMTEVWQTTRPRVETIFRTETTNYFAKSQIAFFSDEPQILGFLFDSVRDTGRTEICRSRHGIVYRPGTKALRDNTPALHFNCRSHLIALANTPGNRKLLEDEDRKPENRKVAPLPPGWRK